MSNFHQATYISYLNNDLLKVVVRENEVRLIGDREEVVAHCLLRSVNGTARLNLQNSYNFGKQHLLAILDGVLSSLFSGASLILEDFSGDVMQDLIRRGLLGILDDGSHAVNHEMLWQHPDLWLTVIDGPYPLRYVMTDGRRHPLRKPKPTGCVYRRYIPWLNRTFSLRSIEIREDLSIFSKWMNDPIVSQFWQEEGDLAKHQRYLEGVAADPHIISLIGCLDDDPFGYFEVYWSKEDRIAPFYDAQDYDRGWHALVGESAFRGQAWLSAWMPSIAHYIFLDDCRTRQITVEPRADNKKIIKSLGRCGYALIKEFDFSHKRAMLGMLSRERFFNEKIWIPRMVDGI